MRIVLLGAPGAGKGTQCKRIVEKYGLQHLSSGDILRKERTQDSELGKKAQQFMDTGALVPDELIVKMMAGAINKIHNCGYVLDGFPRTVNQAAELDKALASDGQKIDEILGAVPEHTIRVMVDGILQDFPTDDRGRLRVILTSWAEQNDKYGEKLRKLINKIENAENEQVFHEALQASVEMEEVNKHLSRILAEL